MSTTENILKAINALNLSQTCDLLYRCDGGDEEDGFMVPALIARLRELVDSDRADYIIRMARDHYGVKIF